MTECEDSLILAGTICSSSQRVKHYRVTRQAERTISSYGNYFEFKFTPGEFSQSDIEKVFMPKC
jgi:hypothetical protein